MGCSRSEDGSGRTRPKDLAERDLLPGLHIVDTGYLDAELLATTPAQFGVDLLGPTRKDYHWQARDGQGFDVQGFTINWDDEQATCPVGRTSISWTPAIDKRRNHVVKIKFSTKDCGPCPLRDQCTRSRKASVRRTITVRPQEQYEALRAAREREQTKAYAKDYGRRPASKARSHRPCVERECVARAMLDWLGPTWDTS